MRDRAGREAADRVHFSSAILPPYLRRSPSVDTLIPWLYLKGVSAPDMGEALEALVGPKAANLSAGVVLKLKEEWAREREAWQTRDLSGTEYVYLWADGIYFTIRLDNDDRQCILVLIGATRDGRKELLAIRDGYRESEQSWHELLVDLKQRGLTIPPKLAIGDGALGFWAALRKVFPSTREQRCWMHKSGKESLPTTSCRGASNRGLRMTSTRSGWPRPAPPPTRRSTSSSRSTAPGTRRRASAS